MLRYAIRKLLRSPGFTAVAVATLALAIGATTTVFSIVYGVLLKPLPYAEPQQLVRLATVNLRLGGDMPMSTIDLRDYIAQARSFSGVAVMDNETVNLTARGQEPLRIRTGRVGASFFDVLGVHAEMGRTFAAGEDEAAAPRVVVISDGLWRGHFGGDGHIVGRLLELDGEAYTVIGVAPRAVALPNERADLWMPFVYRSYELAPANRGGHSVFAIARVRRGVSVQAADREMKTIAARLAHDYPSFDRGFSATAEPLHDQIVQNVRPALWTLLGAVAFVLLMACTNLANLLLVRTTARESEMAVRAALGADRRHIVRQLFTESLILGGAGALAGAAIAGWAVQAIVAAGPSGLPRLNDVAMDYRMLLVAGGVGVLTALLFGLAPALHASRPNVGEMLKAGGRSGTGHRRARRMRAVLVTSEMALAVVLLAGAGLMLRSFAHLLSTDPGFSAEHVLSVDVELPLAKYPTGHMEAAFLDRVVEQVRTLPGVQQAAIAFGRPLSRVGMRVSFEVRGWPTSTPDDRHVADVRPVSNGYFDVMGIPLLRGRSFTGADRADAPGVVLVSEGFARRYFPHQDPIGQHIDASLGRDTVEWGSAPVGGEIVGVVKDVKLDGLSGETYPLMYLPIEQYPMGFVSVLAKTRSDPAALGGPVRAAVRTLDPDLPLFDMMTMNQAVAHSVAQPFFYTVLFGIFAGIALLLATLGIYGVVAYGVSQRSREFGIRIALGATRERVERLVVAQGLGLAAAGIGIGLVPALVLTRLIGSLLVGVRPTDAVSFAAAAVILAGVAAVASYVPARRAARLDAVEALRSD